MLYAWVKTLHVSTVVFTVFFFILRLYWMLHQPHLLARRWVRSLSVVNDTLLLCAGIYMVVVSQQYPLQSPWLMAKLVALLLYILLGMVALRWGTTDQARTLSGLAALLVVGYIALVARQRSPLIF